ncbi:hypothetical protein BGW36DRAFT_429511 [Talaromyces proteolyticus]|uniref:DUF7702 domain-containing protein n=1 Tax=Talaromyces proteolyticus TaxID=1131652 RepID=A0AAD4KNJ0_9EURO|nr:uncharacterized protein BGW36DRAFT_429511 [Talaromyces proteolyticus]KAH8695641.1 hypothetical protein BGW36DRAFT_429511 [Talaromyces proteolyticus]
MPTIDYRHGIAILEVIAFFPSLFLALLLAWRHGFGRSSGWYFFILFSILRVVGNCCYLATINKSSDGLTTAWAICSSIGISPLTLGLIYNVSRVNDSIQRNTGKGFSPQLFRLCGFIAILGIILSIVGIESTSNLTEGMTNSKFKAGLILYLLAWVALVVLILMAWSRYSKIEAGEHRILGAVAICTPLLLVRIIYSIVSTFGHWTYNPEDPEHSIPFSMFFGNVTIQLVMAVVEEILIVYIMLLTGFTLSTRLKAVYEPTEPEETGETGHGPYDRNDNYDMIYAAGNYSSQSRVARKPKRPIRGGPIHMLVAYTANKIDERREREG